MSSWDMGIDSNVSPREHWRFSHLPSLTMNLPRREVVRALLLDHERRILLLHWRDPVTGIQFWEPPGGRREANESHVEALKRELAEETGLTGVVIDGVLRDLEHRFIFAGQTYDNIERYFVCHLAGKESTEPRRDAIEELGILEMRWFRVDELERIPVEHLEPPELLSMLRLADGCPAPE
jgi:8-oxo-dGTP pyrophosphatase MutT (NUDIX family)